MEAVTQHIEYRNAKRRLKTAIRASKRQRWATLIQEIETIPWGLGFKVVMQKLGGRKAPAVKDSTRMESIINVLFPVHPERAREILTVPDNAILPFDETDLQIAVSLLSDKKAPGSGGVPTEVLKLAVRTHPSLFLNIYSCCLREGVFPRTWKIQKLVLIDKGKGEPESPST